MIVVSSIGDSACNRNERTCWGYFFKLKKNEQGHDKAHRVLLCISSLLSCYQFSVLQITIYNVAPEVPIQNT